MIVQSMWTPARLDEDNNFSEGKSIEVSIRLPLLQPNNAILLLQVPLERRALQSIRDSTRLAYTREPNSEVAA